MQKGLVIQWGFKPWLNSVNASGGCHDFLEELKGEVSQMRRIVRQWLTDPHPVGPSSKKFRRNFVAEAKLI